MTPINPSADITPNGTATALGAAGTLCTWFAVTASGTSIRIGNSAVDSTHGLAIPTGTTWTAPRVSFDQGRYDLSQWFVYGAAGSDKISIVAGA